MDVFGVGDDKARVPHKRSWRTLPLYSNSQKVLAAFAFLSLILSSTHGNQDLYSSVQ